jgi:TonB-linked SusC/RagA family outer membrane protein
MKKNKLFLFGVFLIFHIVALGQREISGTITSEDDNLGIPGAKVKIKGTVVGTVSDLDGKYSITITSDKDTLVFSSPELETAEFAVGIDNVINVVLKLKSKTAEEVVVTALGIKRSEKSLGYAVSTVSGDAIRNSNQTNVVNSLNGVVAGANVTQSSGAAGSSSSVVLRGFSSLTGNNQALFVIDGVKINNSESALGGESADNTESVSFSNRGIDINPDDIESLTVLKGGAASAIYGIDGANGVIVITTKKGKANTGGKISVSAGSSVTVSQVNKMPELQTKYAQGWDGDYYGPETGESTSWGPRMDQLGYDPSTPNPYDKNGAIVLNPTGSLTPINSYTNVEDFFKTGYSTKNNFSLTGGNETASLRFSASNTRESGVIPTNTFEKTNVSLNSTLSFFEKKLNISGTANYINSGGDRIQQGSNLSGIMLGLLRTPNSFDNSNGFSKAWTNSESYTLSDGSQRNYRGGGGYDNPFWSVNKNPFKDDVNRLIGNLQASYKFSKWATVGVNLGLDTYTDKRKQIFAIGSRANPTGKVTEEVQNVKQIDSYYTLSGGGAISKNKNFDIAYQAGLNTFMLSSSQLYSIGRDFAFENFGNLGAATSINSSNFTNGYKSFSMYGNVDLGYKSMVYLTFTGRQDYDSRFMVPGAELSMKDIGFFYPSVSSSFVFSELIKNKKVLDFGKVRMSFAQVSKGPADAYSTSTVYEQLSGTENITDSWTGTSGISFPYNGITSFGLSNTQGNPNLKPETSREFELGTNLSFLKRRFILDVAVYYRKTKDAIIPAPVSGTTGYSQILMNSGEMHTKGIDASLNVAVFRKKSFEWNIGSTFTKYISIVDKLADGLDKLFVGGFSDVGIYHIAGQQYGQLYGGDFARTADGQLLIEDDVNSANYGYPVVDPEFKVIGNPNPKFIAGLTNSFKIYNFDVSFLIDIKVGGDMWNGTLGALTFFGMSKNTEDRDAVGETSKVFEGVKGHYDENGNIVTSNVANDVSVGLDQNWYTANGGGFGNVSAPFIQNASSYRLRNFSVGYTFHLKKMSKAKLNEFRVYVSGNNLLLFTPYTGVDPETSLTGSSSNAKGLDYFNMPNTRSVTFGVNIKL